MLSYITSRNDSYVAVNVLVLGHCVQTLCREQLCILYFRPSDIHVGGLRFYCDSIFFCFRPLPSELAKRNSTKIGHMLGSKCDVKIHVRNVGYPLPLQIGGPETTFSTTSQYNGNFNGVYRRKET